MTVSKDLAHLRAQWRAAASHDFAAKQAEELAKLAHLEREAWEAWERSCEVAETTSEKMVLADAKESSAVSPKGAVKETTASVLVKVIYRRRIRGRCGDPRFLELVARCIEIRLRMFGFLDAPQGSGSNVIVNWDGITSLSTV
jgi:hypothetical protein